MFLVKTRWSFLLRRVLHLVVETRQERLSLRATGCVAQQRGRHLVGPLDQGGGAVCVVVALQGEVLVDVELLAAQKR